MSITITIVPLGTIEASVLAAIKRGLSEELAAQVETLCPQKVPKCASDMSRGQYHASVVRDSLRGNVAPGAGAVLGVCDIDLYVPGLNFVFGEACGASGTAIISLTRLRNSFYGVPEDEALFQQRAVKEAVHEVGHVLGMSHCRKWLCVMFFSNSLADTDRKSASFCEKCGRLLL